MELAKDLRRNMTHVERLLWKALSGKQLGHKFRRQQAIGEYIVDFICMEKKLVVELDGGQHASSGLHHDEQRTRFLNQHGYTVLRFWNNDVTQSLEGVVDTIRNTLAGLVSVKKPPTPNPSRRREGNRRRRTGMEEVV